MIHLNTMRRIMIRVYNSKNYFVMTITIDFQIVLKLYLAACQKLSSRILYIIMSNRKAHYAFVRFQMVSRIKGKKEQHGQWWYKSTPLPRKCRLAWPSWIILCIQDRYRSIYFVRALNKLSITSTEETNREFNFLSFLRIHR